MLTRRAFIEGAVVAAGAVAGVSRGGAAASAMFVSLNASLTGTLPWPDFARLAARLGYGGVDVNLNGARTQGVGAARALLGELEIAPSVANIPVRFTGDETAYREDLKGLDEAAAFLRGIACP